MTAANVRLDRGQLGAISRLAAGGQGVVHTAPGVTMPYAAALVYKEYKDAALAGLDVSVLEAMPTYLETLPLSEAVELLSLAAWPCRLVESAGRVRGFVMPAIPDAFFLDIRKASGLGRQAGELQLLLNNDSFLARRTIPLTDRHRYELIGATARALAVFHRHEIAVGDLSPKNLLFSLSSPARVFFVDCDAMRFQGRSVGPQLETPEWEVRASHPGEELATWTSDAFKLGLVALRLLVGDQSTRDPGRLPDSVPPDVRQLITATLQAGPADRPALADWEQPLQAAADGASTAPPGAGGGAGASAPPATSGRTPGSPEGRTTLTGPPGSPSTPGGPGPAGPADEWWRKPPALVGAGVAAVVLLVALVAGTSGGGDDSATETPPVTVDAPQASTTQATFDSTTTTSTDTGTPGTVATTTADGWFTPAPGECDDAGTARLRDDGLVATDCQLIDVGAGEATQVDVPSTADASSSSGAIVGDRYVWWETVDVPADGLAPPTRRHTLRSKEIDGFGDEELLAVDGDQSSTVQVLGVSGERFLDAETLDGSSVLVLREVDGTEVARFAAESGGGGSGGTEPFDGIVSDGSTAVDMTRAEALAPELAAYYSWGSSGLDPCLQRAVASDGYDTLTVLRRGPDGLSSSSLPSPEHTVEAIAEGDRLLASGGAGLQAHASDGSLLWELPYEVVSSWKVLGGTPFVMNASGEVVPVDPATGQEATVSAELQEAAEVWFDGGRIVTNGATGGVLLIDGDGRMKVVSIPQCKVR